MKKIIAAIAVVTMGLSASSCADFLDVQPEGNPNQGGYFQTDKEAEDAIGAVYWIFDKEETWGRNLFWEQGCGDDMVCNQSRWPSLMNFQYTGDESPLTDNWEKMTEYIARANWVVAGLKAKGVDKLTAVETARWARRSSCVPSSTSTSPTATVVRTTAARSSVTRTIPTTRRRCFRPSPRSRPR